MEIRYAKFRERDFLHGSIIRRGKHDSELRDVTVSNKPVNGPHNCATPPTRPPTLQQARSTPRSNRPTCKARSHQPQPQHNCIAVVPGGDEVSDDGVAGRTGVAGRGGCGRPSSWWSLRRRWGLGWRRSRNTWRERGRRYCFPTDRPGGRGPVLSVPEPPPRKVLRTLTFDTSSDPPAR